MLQRRDFLKTSAAVTSALALPSVARAQASKLLRFVPQWRKPSCALLPSGSRAGLLLRGVGGAVRRACDRHNAL